MALVAKKGVAEERPPSLVIVAPLWRPVSMRKLEGNVGIHDRSAHRMNIRRISAHSRIKWPPWSPSRKGAPSTSLAAYFVAASSSHGPSSVN